LASFSIVRGQFVQRLGLHGLDLIHPVQGKTVKGRKVVVRTTDFEEFALPPLKALLEERYENPSRDIAEAHPEALPLFLHFKEVQEDVNGRCAPEEAAQNTKGLDEGPAIGVQLGWGDINLRQQLPPKSGERQAHPNTLEDNLVEVEEGEPVVGPLVLAYRLL